MEKLFQPFEAKGLHFKNRLVHEPTTMNMSDPHGHVTEKLVGVYETLGIVFTGADVQEHGGADGQRDHVAAA